MPDLLVPAHPHSLPASTIGAAVRSTAAAFREAGLSTPALDARIIVAEACEMTVEDTVGRADTPLKGIVRARLKRFISRRLNGEPVSRIIGRREFWGLTFSISPHTLDPRPETELLVESVLDYVRAKSLSLEPLRVLDLGTGSGCLLAALLVELPLARGVAVDLSFDALVAARENLRRLGLLDRASFLCGNWARAIRGTSFDVVVCNPPYIASDKIESLGAEVRRFDPPLALDGGPDGLDGYREVIPQARDVLGSQGYLILEIGCDQAEKVREILESCQGTLTLGKAETLRDLSGRERAVAVMRQSASLEAGSKKKVGNLTCSGYGLGREATSEIGPSNGFTRKQRSEA